MANTRVPLVKLTHGPTDTSVDICINQKGGPECAELMNDYLERFPPLRPLCFVMKYFLKVRDLHKPYTGGIGSFAVQLMVLSFLQMRFQYLGRDSCDPLKMNLGSLLLEFFELYGLDFNYVTTGISVREDGCYFPKGSKEKRDMFWNPTKPFQLALENPHDPKSDVGCGSYRIKLIQRVFDVAFRLLLVHVSEPVCPALSILSSILPTERDNPLHERARDCQSKTASNNERTFSSLDKSLPTNRIKNKESRKRAAVNSDMSTSEDENVYDHYRNKRRNFTRQESHKSYSNSHFHHSSRDRGYSRDKDRSCDSSRNKDKSRDPSRNKDRSRDSSRDKDRSRDSSRSRGFEQRRRRR